MTYNSIISAGIDVAKLKLDIVIYPSGQHLTVDYDAAGLKQMDGFMQAHHAVRAGFEASGGYEWRLLTHLRAGPIQSARFQPFQIKAFAKSKLRRAKNDKLDAGVIAEFTASQETMPALPDARLDGLADHLTYIEQIEDQLARLKTMLETTHDNRIRRAYANDIARLDRRKLAEIALLVKYISTLEPLKRKLELLQSIKGVGLRTALAFLVRLPEIGSMSREQAAAMAGLAPYDDDSGKRRGLRHIAGGRSRLRKSLFMSAFTSTRCNPDLKAFYSRLRDNGKLHRVAVIATARKLVITANAIIARNTPWLPKITTP